MSVRRKGTKFKEEISAGMYKRFGEKTTGERRRQLGQEEKRTHRKGRNERVERERETGDQEVAANIVKRIERKEKEERQLKIN